MCKLLGKLDGFDLADEDLRAFGNLDTRKSRDLMSLLANYLCIERTVDNDRFSDLFGLLRIEEIAASFRKLRLDLIVYLIENDHGLLRCADHSVVKCFGMNYRVDGEDYIRGIVYDRGGVTFIIRFVISRLGTSIQSMIPSGAPAATAASSTSFAAAMVEFFALG